MQFRLSRNPGPYEGDPYDDAQPGDSVLVPAGADPSGAPTEEPPDAAAEADADAQIGHAVQLLATLSRELLAATPDAVARGVAQPVSTERIAAIGQVANAHATLALAAETRAARMVGREVVGMLDVIASALENEG